MPTRSEVKAAFESFIKQYSKSGDQIFTAEVTEVDKKNRVCSAVGLSDQGGVNYTDILLMACADDGPLYIPKKGSAVIVCNNSNQQPFIMMFSELDEIFYVVGNSVMSFQPGLIEFNGGENGPLMNIAPSLAAWKATQEDINKLKQAFAAWVPVPNDGGAALKTALTANYPSALLSITQQSDIEDTKITH